MVIVQYWKDRTFQCEAVVARGCYSLVLNRRRVVLEDMQYFFLKKPFCITRKAELQELKLKDQYGLINRAFPIEVTVTSSCCEVSRKLKTRVE